LESTSARSSFKIPENGNGKSHSGEHISQTFAGDQNKNHLRLIEIVNLILIANSVVVFQEIGLKFEELSFWYLNPDSLATKEEHVNVT
jgi:hypothetical protein